MDTSTYLTTMPCMDIFAHEPVPGTEKSMLRRQQRTPERRFSISFEDFDDDFDMEDDYFSRTYAPLSCLPTPPPSCSPQSPFTQALESAFGDNEVDDSLLGPTIHLSNLIPTSASLLTPSPTLVHDILYYANLPQPILELAVVILDSLSTKFATNYRRQLPLSTVHPFKGGPNHQHIDDVRPELIAMTSLLVANKFLDDDEMRTSTSKWQWDIGMDLWTCQQINTCERLILDCIGWNIMELAGEWLMAEARDDMARAGVNARKKQNKNRRPRLERTELGVKEVKMEMRMEMEGARERVDVLDVFEQKASGSSNGSIQFMGQWTPVESPVAKGRACAQ